jgi:hypothetical protein
MAVLITAVRHSAGSRHENISHLRWTNLDGPETDSSTLADMIDWIAGGGHAFVEAGHERAPVLIVEPVSGVRHLRSRRDSAWSDELLRLPGF